jgi:hypothetical protein
LYADPYVLGFDYQSFGVWGTGLVPGSTARIGAISAGMRTAATAVPASGNATFNGGVGGIYVDNTGSSFRYGASATFGVNFATRSISMITTGDTLVNISTNAVTGTSTPMTATMTYGAGSNAIRGTFQVGNLMSGSGSGWFYGPAANELGGTFFISGSAGKMLGGFGGKR